MIKKNLINMLKIIIPIALLLIFSNILIGNFNANDLRQTPESDTTKILEPKNYYTTENQLITTILSRYHYNKIKIDDSLSSMLLDKYLKVLDFSRIYFLKSDISEFENYRYVLDDYLLEGIVDPFYEIFNRYTLRLAERIAYLDTILMNEFNFNLRDSIEIGREDAELAENYSMMDSIWYKRVKADALNLKLTGKNGEEIVTNLSKRYENYERLLQQYNSEDVFQLAMDAYTTCFDPHTNYLSPVSSENFKIDMSLSLEGIGARLMYDEGYTKVVEIIPGGPAFTSKKLQVDDRIIAVAQGEDGDFVDVVGWRITDVVQLIRGPKETIVRLQILPAEGGLNANPVEISLVRDKIKLEEQAAKSEIIEVTNNGIPYRIGVIIIPKFYTDFDGQRNGEKESKSTVTDVRRILEELKSEKVDGVVVDLRNNGGGSLIEAIDVTGLFIKDGPVVQVKDAFGSIDVNKDPDSEIVYSGPLAVLINRFSASASEIFSAAIQDYERGIIIGEQSYGKGTVQNLIDLNRLASHGINEFGQVKVTIAKYYRITGGSTQNLGVIPDITLPSFVNPDEFGESSEPTALPWDQIEATKFKKFSDFKRILPELVKASELRRENDPDFELLNSDIEDYKISNRKKYISLSEEIRLREKEAEESRDFERENMRRQKKGLKLLEKGETAKETEEEDLFIRESALILTDLIQLSDGLTQVH